MNYRRLVYLYRSLLKDLKTAQKMSDPVFKRKLRQTIWLSRKIIDRAGPRLTVTESIILAADMVEVSTIAARRKKKDKNV